MVHDMHGVRVICWHNQVRQGTICGPPSLVAYKGGVTMPCLPSPASPGCHVQPAMSFLC